MDITLSALRANPSKYFNMACNADIFVTRRGKRLGRIVAENKITLAEDKKTLANRQKAIKSLLKIAASPSQYINPTADPDYELLREEIYRERGLL